MSCWIRIRIRNADPGDKFNADPCGSGSETLGGGNIVLFGPIYRSVLGGASILKVVIIY
jgi:hypothetical protein